MILCYIIGDTYGDTANVYYIFRFDGIFESDTAVYRDISTRGMYSTHCVSPHNIMLCIVV